MKQQKKSWVKTLLSFAETCKGKMILSVLCAIFSVAGGFIPFWAVYKILLLLSTVLPQETIFCYGAWLA